MDRYEKEKNGNQEVEEYLKTLLDNEVKPLWPKGWMQTRALIRESRKLLGFFPSLPIKKTRPDKKQSSICGASTVLDVLQGAPPQKVELPQDSDVFPEASNISSSISLDVGKKAAAPLKSIEAKKGGVVTVVAGSSTPAESGEPPVSGASAAPAHSLLDLLADQALAREQPLAISQEILAAAIAKYRRSGQHWSYAVDTKRPPPPPQSSPVNFPVSRVCQVILPQPGDFTRNLDVQIISDDSCITIQ
nr:PREDICTED: ubinuclein-2-like [Paralichthys olivaceus]